jgi:hypothetical protein
VTSLIKNITSNNPAIIAGGATSWRYSNAHGFIFTHDLGMKIKHDSILLGPSLLIRHPVLGPKKHQLDINIETGSFNRTNPSARVRGGLAESDVAALAYPQKSVGGYCFDQKTLEAKIVASFEIFSHDVKCVFHLINGPEKLLQFLDSIPNWKGSPSGKVITLFLQSEFMSRAAFKATTKSLNDNFQEEVATALLKMQNHIEWS